VNRNIKIIGAVVLIGAALMLLLVSTSASTAATVVTVAQLSSKREGASRLRLGARVSAAAAVRAETLPSPSLAFSVEDPGRPGISIPVVYKGVIPDSFAAGRDVILEGTFDGNVFHAANLLTQCPSKYKPPTPKVEATQ
jgi:cytochrome c-type biogenesis protein CcmE